MTRRELLFQSLALAMWGSSQSYRPAIWAQVPRLPTQSLRRALIDAGIQVGTAATQSLLKVPEVAAVVANQFNVLTASGMKWLQIHPTPDTYDFEEADWNVAFAERNGMQLHGHNLCWNNTSANPAWLGDLTTKSEARDALTAHISTVVTRYKGRVASWDVVNEPVVSWPGRSDGLYPGVWVNLLGPEYLDVAFHTAQAADPNALRVLNVHHVEQQTPDCVLTRQRVLGWLRQLLSRGVPVQAVGLESHLNAAQPLEKAALGQFLADIRSLGLKVLITELDVQESRSTGTSTDWDVAVATQYHDYLVDTLSSVKPEAIIFWSLKDRWENGKKIQGLLEDDLSPRRSFYAVEQAFLNQAKGLS